MFNLMCIDGILFLSELHIILFCYLLFKLILIVSRLEFRILLTDVIGVFAHVLMYLMKTSTFSCPHAHMSEH